MYSLTNSRRQFIQKSLWSASALVLPWNTKALMGSNKVQPLRIGICADPHKDIMHDADQRLQVFIDRVKKEKVDFIIQMGDFCVPKENNSGFLEIWKQFQGPSYHVIGNHDTDGGFTREDVLSYWGMPSKYHSFDRNGYHFIVLDGNDPNPEPWTGYVRYIGPNQMRWLEEDLDKTTLPTFVFSHQSLENFEGVDNKQDVRKILEKANEKSSSPKVVACFSGHHHIDYHTQINGIYYLQINSMSYQWLGEDYQQVRYSQEIDQKYPWIKYTVPYKDCLYALVTLTPQGEMQIEGIQSEFVGPSPKELGHPKQPANNKISPNILDKTIKLNLG